MYSAGRSLDGSYSLRRRKGRDSLVIGQKAAIHDGVGHVLQRSAGRRVVLEPGGVIAKHFADADPGTAIAAAQREFDRLTRFHAALRDAGGATCPAPIELTWGSHPVIRMQQATGMPLSEYLGRQELSDRRCDDLAGRMANALRVYVSTFNEPYYDFHLRNTLYDPGASTPGPPSDGLLVLLDFGIPLPEPFEESMVRLYTPIEVSLGNLVCSTVFESARPLHWFRARQHRQAGRLVSAVLRAFSDGEGGEPVSMVTVRSAFRARYAAVAYGGSQASFAWYSTVGFVLARDLSMALARSQPPGPWPSAEARLRRS